MRKAEDEQAREKLEEIYAEHYKDSKKKAIEIISNPDNMWVLVADVGGMEVKKEDNMLGYRTYANVINIRPTEPPIMSGMVVAVKNMFDHLFEALLKIYGSVMVEEDDGERD